MSDSWQLAMFSGKGGVGKTTLSCGFARQWALRFPQERILLLSTDPAHSLADVLQLPVRETPDPLPDLPNLSVRALSARSLLENFKAKYGKVLELLVERGSFVEGEDLTPAWDMSWPGLDELMGILEIQRLFREKVVDRLVVDMAPTGHALNLLGLMDFLDNLLKALEMFQQKHRVISRTFVGRYAPDEADGFLEQMQADLATGRQLIQDEQRTACLIVAIAEPMSFLETQRLFNALQDLKITCGGFFVNKILPEQTEGDRYHFQQQQLAKFIALADGKPVFTIPQLTKEPLGAENLDRLISQITPASSPVLIPLSPPPPLPEKIPPSFADFIAEGRRLIVVGGKGGVGKTTVAAAISWGMANKYPDKHVRVISIDPAHSLGDAFGEKLGHEPKLIADNLSAVEIDAEQILTQFREDYLWELAEMMSGDSGDSNSALQLAYGPQAWRQIVSQALPGIDEMLSLVAIMDLLEKQEQDLIILDTAPTGHLLRFLEMPAALSDWLAWIFKLWIKYQDVLGRTEFMGRLRSLRQRVVQAQKKLKDSQHTEFIGVVQAEEAILAEAERLAESLTAMGVFQRYLVHNCYRNSMEIKRNLFNGQIVVRLPVLPRCIEALAPIKVAAKLLF